MAKRPGREVRGIVVSTFNDVRLHLKALQKGAFDFITPPIDIADVEYVVRNSSQMATVIPLAA